MPSAPATLCQLAPLLTKVSGVPALTLITVGMNRLSTSDTVVPSSVSTTSCGSDGPIVGSAWFGVAAVAGTSGSSAADVTGGASAAATVGSLVGSAATGLAEGTSPVAPWSIDMDMSPISGLCIGTVLPSSVV